MALDGETTDLEELTPDPSEDGEAPEVEEEITVTIEGEPAGDEEPEEPAAQKSWVNKLRKDREDAVRKARDLERRLAEKEAAEQAAAQPQDPGPMPQPQDVGFDDDAHQAAVLKWVDDVAAFKQVKAAQDAKAQAEKDRWAGLHKGYEDGKKALSAPDYKAAEDAVVSLLSVQQQSAILEVIEDPAKFVYALGKNPAKAEELAKLGNSAKFIAAIAKLEGKMTVERKTIPAESRLPGSNASIGGGSMASRLAAAQKAAERTGDYDEVYKIKREMKAAGVKA